MNKASTARSPFEVRATFPLEASRRLWELALCQSRVKGVTQVMRKLALIMFSMTSAGVYVPASLPSPAFAFANDTSGAAVFKGHCTPCHGADGKGKAYVGTPDFTSPKIQASLTDSEIMDIITNGRKAPSCPLGKARCRRRIYPRRHLTYVPWVVATDCHGKIGPGCCRAHSCSRVGEPS